ncbi:hypothetical protein HYH03_008017 [Edaphochlamys debaryana]|uniref:Uncharacterized protein n=1 Tax=Edaphochlamys debaryana TaxID=47281 RepID=A0A836BZC5_9CHLO|nr:hypothetical protein HYH03_008017 [Edaphochlamys debaryana]|eukprot:KAG2493797.1 hypothetical protein HYH03_008017 [Edaphochlamys debaryana]
MAVELESLKRRQDAEIARLKEEHKASLTDIDEWCRGEIEAVQHNARKQAAQAHIAVEQWQRKYDEAQQAAAELERSRREEEMRALQLAGDLASAHEALAAAQEELLRLQRQRAEEAAQAEEARRDAEARAAEQLEAQAAAHTAALSNIEVRLAAVVSRKDATITALRTELQKTHETLLALRGV